MADWAIWLLGGGTAGTAALAMLWALLWDRSRGRLRCPRCWYDLGGAPRAVPTAPFTCPECGRQVTRARQMRRTRRRWLIALPAAVVALAVGWVAPLWATRGWIATIPQPALDLMIGVFYTEQAADAFAQFPIPGTSWERTLVSWELRRRWTLLASESDLPPVPNNLSETALRQAALERSQAHARQISESARALSRTMTLFLITSPAERRGLARTLSCTALRTGSPYVQDSALDAISSCRSNGMGAPEALPSLWRLARTIEERRAGYRLLRALLAADPRCPRAENLDQRSRWFERTLRRRRLSPVMWRVVISAAMSDGPAGVAVAEAEIWRSPAQNLAGAVQRMHEVAFSGVNQDTIYPALFRLTQHPDPTVRAPAVEGLSYGVSIFPEGRDAIREALQDQNPAVAAAARAALDRFGG